MVISLSFWILIFEFMAEGELVRACCLTIKLLFNIMPGSVAECRNFLIAMKDLG
jgi:hypothetical protein